LISRGSAAWPIILHLIIENRNGMAVKQYGATLC
jgi:hypothetical protein